MLVEWDEAEEEVLAVPGGVAVGLETFKFALVCVL